MTKKTAISLPDGLYREIERARRRSGMDRSTWIQEAANEYLRKRTREEEVESWLRAYERVPLTPDELAFIKWSEKQTAEHLAAIPYEPGPREVAAKRRRK